MTAKGTVPDLRRDMAGLSRRVRRGLLLFAAGALVGGAGARAGAPAAPGDAALDRVAVAVAGVESTYGTDPAMWRWDPEGPQGPMQLSAAAARDAGGGDRFDAVENRALGRNYLAELYRRYRDWPDAVAAYNWGPGNMDAWIDRGRPALDMPAIVALYRFRVMRIAIFGPAALGVLRPGLARRPPRRSAADLRQPSRASIAVERLYGAILRLAASQSQ